MNNKLLTILKKQLTSIISSLIVITVIVGAFFIIKPKKKMEKTMFLNTNKVVELTLSEIETKINSKGKWILYIGNSMCGDCKDFKEFVVPTLLEQNPKLTFYYTDFFKRKLQDKVWDDIIGVKNDDTNTKLIESPMLKGLYFKYTPTLVITEDGKVLGEWDGFGGGDLRSTRYYRNADDKIPGYKNAINDIQKLLDSTK